MTAQSSVPKRWALELSIGLAAGAWHAPPIICTERLKLKPHSPGQLLDLEPFNTCRVQVGDVGDRVCLGTLLICLRQLQAHLPKTAINEVVLLGQHQGIWLSHMTHQLEQMSQAPPKVSVPS